MWLKNLINTLNFSEAWSRFSLSISAAIAIAVLFIFKMEDVVPFGGFTDSVAIRAFYALSLLYVLGVFFSFNKIKSSWPKYYGTILAMVLSVLYFFILPSFPTEYTFARHAVLLGIVILAVPLTKFWEKEEEAVFWAQVVHSIFLFVETSFFSLFLYAALSLALVAIEKLFGIDFTGIEIYADLFIVIAVIFHPVYYLSKYKTREELKYDFRANTFIKTFSSKILLSTVLLYALILALYFLKIIVSTKWPNGWVSNLILSFSIMGVLCYGINKYLFGKPATGVLKIFKKWFFPFLLVCCVFLCMAIYIRVNEYAITEPRYLVVCSAVWLSIMSLYFIISKRKDLRYLFVSLIAFLAFMFYSPFNLFDASINSQKNRLSSFLSENGLDVSGAEVELEKEQRYQLTQMLRFFTDRKRVQEIQGLSSNFSELSFPDYLTREKPEFLFFFSLYENVKSEDPVSLVFDALNQEPLYTLSGIEVEDHFSFRSNINEPIPLDSFNYLVRLNYPVNGTSNSSIVTLASNRAIVFGQDSIPLESILPKNYKQMNVNDPPLVYNYISGDKHYRLTIREANWNRMGGGLNLTYLRSECLIR